MSQLLKKRQQVISGDNSQSHHENIRKQLKKEEENVSSTSINAQEIVHQLPQISFSSSQSAENQEIIMQVKNLQEEIEKCIQQKNYKSIARILRKKLVHILSGDSQKKMSEIYQKLLSILVSCLSLQTISNNFFLQKAFCDSLEQILTHYNEMIDSNCIDVLFNLINVVESGGIKECLLNIIIRLSKKNIQKCKKSISENQDNSDLNNLSVKMKFKFIKLLYRIISEEIPEQELQSSQKNTSSAHQNSALQNSALQSSAGGSGSPFKNGSNTKPAKSFQSQLIAEMVRWLQQEPLISSKVLRFLLNIESRQATIVKLCLLKNINLNEDSQLYFLDFLKYLFQQSGNSQGDIIQKVFQYINNCIRSLSYQIRLKASQILHYFPYFDHTLLLRTIKLEQFQDYGKPLNSTPTSIHNITPTKSDQEKFQISHGFGAIVHLLEDEFNEVRKSAIEIIQNFGQLNEQFGRDSRDILFYMLNDENDSVRIKAIQAISQVLAQESCEIRDGSKKKLVTITNEEMDNLMFNLKEKVPRLRIVIYKLLGKVKLEGMSQLNMILDIGLRNINQFSDDSYIYEMCKNIGEHNSSLVQKNICQILQIADILYVQEPHWKDKAHIYRVIMISNSFKNKEDLAQHSEELLPSYFLKQYDMMQDLMSQYFHPLYSYEQSQLSLPKTNENDKKSAESDKKQSEGDNDNKNKMDQEVNNNKKQEETVEENEGIKQQQQQQQQAKEEQINQSQKSSSLYLLNLLVSSLQDIHKKKDIFKVIRENAKSQQAVNGPEQDQFQFINKLSKIAYLINVFIRQVSRKKQINLDIQVLKFQFNKILRKLHSLQSKFILDEANQRLVQRVLFITILQLPLLHMLNSSTNSSVDSFEQISFLKTMAFIQEIIRDFEEANNNKVQSNLQIQSMNQSTSSVRPASNPFLLLHSCLEEGRKIATDVQTNLIRLQTSSTRQPLFQRYYNFLSSLPYRLIFSKRDYNMNQQQSIANNQLYINDFGINVKVRKARIFLPKDETVDIQSKYMAKTGFVAEVRNFESVEERKNLQLVVEYSDCSSESMQLIEDDFVYLTEQTHVINTSIFFQKINWTSDSLVTISLKYFSPLTLFNRNTIMRDVTQLLPSSSSTTITASSSSTSITPAINLINSSSILAQSKPFTLVIKSRVI